VGGDNHFFRLLFSNQHDQEGLGAEKKKEKKGEVKKQRKLKAIAKKREVVASAAFCLHHRILDICMSEASTVQAIQLLSIS
jgi:hypothetical protein